jgi:hypothetical protein
LQTPEWKKIAWRYLDWVCLVIVAAAIVSASVENNGSRGWTSFTLLVIGSGRRSRAACCTMALAAVPRCVHRPGKLMSLACLILCACMHPTFLRLGPPCAAH